MKCFIFKQNLTLIQPLRLSTYDSIPLAFDVVKHQVAKPVCTRIVSFQDIFMYFSDWISVLGWSPTDFNCFISISVSLFNDLQARRHIIKALKVCLCIQCFLLSFQIGLFCFWRLKDILPRYRVYQGFRHAYLSLTVGLSAQANSQY